MAASAGAPSFGSTGLARKHAAFVRVTHWITTLCFVALVVSGVEIVLSHPRFYWGETGNVNTSPWFKIPVPSSRRTVPTGYGYVLPDQNGWSRSLHFEAAWLVVFTGIVYVGVGLVKGHIRRNLEFRGGGHPAGSDFQVHRALCPDHLGEGGAGDCLGLSSLGHLRSGERGFGL